MNQDRRNRIEAALNKLDEVKSEVEGLAAEEREAFDNLSEGLQQSEKGEAIEEAANSLESAVDSLDSAYGDMQSAMGA